VVEHLLERRAARSGSVCEVVLDVLAYECDVAGNQVWKILLAGDLIHINKLNKEHFHGTRSQI
jgi:hypothetical protein